MITLALVVPARAADGPDETALINDLTKMQKTPDKLTIALWMPDEFWNLALSSSGRLTAKAMADTLSALRPYTLIAVVDAKPGAFGAFNFTDDQTLMNSVRLEDSSGTLYQPLAPGLVSAPMRNLVDAFRPMMANVMGAMGEHMGLLIFPSTDKAGRRFAVGAGNGSLTVHVGDVALRYRLPLQSLLPPSSDPKTGESFPGTYRFNPYTGDRLNQGHWSGNTPSSNR